MASKSPRRDEPDEPKAEPAAKAPVLEQPLEEWEAQTGSQVVRTKTRTVQRPEPPMSVAPEPKAKKA